MIQIDNIIEVPERMYVSYEPRLVLGSLLSIFALGHASFPAYTKKSVEEGVRKFIGVSGSCKKTINLEDCFAFLMKPGILKKRKNQGLKDEIKVIKLIAKNRFLWFLEGSGFKVQKAIKHINLTGGSIDFDWKNNLAVVTIRDKATSKTEINSYPISDYETYVLLFKSSDSKNKVDITLMTEQGETFQCSTKSVSAANPSVMSPSKGSVRTIGISAWQNGSTLNDEGVTSCASTLGQLFDNRVIRKALISDASDLEVTMAFDTLVKSSVSCYTPLSKVDEAKKADTMLIISGEKIVCFPIESKIFTKYITFNTQTDTPSGSRDFSSMEKFEYAQPNQYCVQLRISSKDLAIIFDDFNIE